jgi:tRNA-splicing ligase RtcB
MVSRSRGSGFRTSKPALSRPAEWVYDINCGVRLLRTDLKRSEIEKKLEMLMRTLFNHIPSGVRFHRFD